MAKKHASSSRPSWASDDNASNLLDSILDDTKDAALAETEQLAQAVEAKRLAEEQAREQARLDQQADTQSRLQKEAARQEQLAARRTAAMKAITAADAPEPEQEHPTPTIIEHKELLPAVAVEPLAPVQPLAAPPQRVDPTPPPPQSSGVLYAALAAAGVAIVGAGALIAALAMPGYTPDPTPYPKVVMQPTLTRDLVTGEAFRPVPEDEPPAAIVEAPKASKKPKKARSGKRPTKPKTPKKPKKPSLGDLLGDDGDDIFGTMDKSSK